MRHLRALVFDAISKFLWSLLLPLVQRILNKTYRQLIGCAPHSFVYLSAPDLDRGLFEPFRDRATLATVTTSYMRQLLEAREHLLDLTSLHIDREQKKLRANLGNVVPTDFPVGSLVLASYLNRPTSKLHTRKAGPFQVVNRSANNVLIRNLTNGEERYMDVSRLTPFIGAELLQQNQAIAAADLGETAVERILEYTRNRRDRKSLSFRVLWSDGEETWEPWKTVRRLAALDDFLSKLTQACVFSLYCLRISPRFHL